jgi:putative membrane protein
MRLGAPVCYTRERLHFRTLHAGTPVVKIQLQKGNNPMNAKFSFISRIALAAVAAGNLGVVATLCAQMPAYTPDNPYLQKRAATPPPSRGTPNPKASTLSAKDKDFLVTAASSGGWEVETGKVAEGKAQSDATRNLAARIVAEHSKANKEVVELAKKKGLAISTENIKPQRGLSGGAKFDKQYLTLTEQDHQQAIKAFEKEAASGDDSEIKAWAAKMLPSLKQHLSMVESALSKAE